MRTVELDEDLYAFIASQTQRIGESASDILRRLLNVTKKVAPAKGDAVSQKHELSETLSNPNFAFLSSKEQFLAILGEAHRQKKMDFEKILALRGRDRIYFAKSEREISASGNSTFPEQIPGTNYWAMTNASNVKKAQMLCDALRVLGFSAEAQSAAKTAIWRA